MNIIEKSDAMLDINVKDVSLVLEGGTFRTVFTMGILDAFLDAGIMMPHISGVSAGITYAGSYISQQKGRNIQILMSETTDIVRCLHLSKKLIISTYRKSTIP